MEFVLLPLLLIVGLFATLDSGHDDDGNATGTDDDTLAGSDDDRIFGGTGDDVLTLSETATGFGGEGGDSITATDASTGYGMDGDDTLFGDENATIKGGSGDDLLFVEDEALAMGGDGDDILSARNDAAAYGGAGDDTLTATDDARAYGGAGNDSFLLSGLAYAAGGEGDDFFLSSEGNNTVFSGEGKDLTIIDHKASHDSPGDPASVTLTTEEFNHFDDRLGFLLGSRDLAGFTLNRYTLSDENVTVVSLTQTAADGSVTQSSFDLIGSRGFALRDIVLYGEDLNDVITWEEFQAAQPVGATTVMGGAGDDVMTLGDGQVGMGNAGDDQMTATGDADIFGGAGDDTMTGGNIVDGGQGDDVLLVHGVNTAQGSNHAHIVVSATAYGGDGDDTISGISGATDGDTEEAIGGPALYGGEGDDVIRASHIFSVVAGPGDDVVSVVNDASHSNDAVIILGEGSDVVLLEDGDYISSAGIADFDPSQDRLAVIIPQGSYNATQPVQVTWDGALNRTLIQMDEGFSFGLTGVNGEVTPINLAFYTDEAAFQADQPYRTI